MQMEPGFKYKKPYEKWKKRVAQLGKNYGTVKEAFEDLYRTRRQEDIARIFGVTIMQISLMFERLGIRARPRAVNDPNTRGHGKKKE
ncbi:MAG: hypothetical protein ABID54_14900 [Pseudomonadota bacterium]